MIGRKDQPGTREGQTGRDRAAERLIVPMKPGNAGGGNGPQFPSNARRSEAQGTGKPTNPGKLQDLQTALHTKAKGAPTYRFYALYDKLYRADVLAEAYRRCRVNGGAPGVDRQKFEDIEVRA